VTINIKRRIEYRYRVFSIRKRCRLYKLSVESFVRLFMAQAGKCAICYAELTLSSARIDHDHGTRLVRGLLCFHCNTGLGLFKDNRRLLYNAWLYLG
jgi:hypothetical protein